MQSSCLLIRGLSGLQSPESARAVNVDATSRVIDRLVQWGIVPVFTSSDAVFGEGRGSFGEDDIAEPCVEYGRQKLEIEDLLGFSKTTGSLPSPESPIR